MNKGPIRQCGAITAKNVGGRTELHGSNAFLERFFNRFTGPIGDGQNRALQALPLKNKAIQSLAPRRQYRLTRQTAPRCVLLSRWSIAIEPLHILVTGFGKFPGAAKNPTAEMILALGKYKPRLARLGIALDLHVLPVVYAEIAPRLAALTKTFEPDAILHFGLAARRKAFCVETRAVNRLSPLHRDAAGARAPDRAVVPGAAPIMKSTLPSSRIAAALARAGIKAEASIDAGDYICNQTLYLSLAARRARSIGFIHVPRLAPRRRSKSGAKAQRPTLETATRAAVIAILVMAMQLRRAPREKLEHVPVSSSLSGTRSKPAPALDRVLFVT